VTLPEIGVNLLWCVPGDVGGSEEYLVRQLLGLAEGPSRQWTTALYVLAEFAERYPELAHSYEVRIAPFGGSHRVRRVVGESTWLRRAAASSTVLHHGGGTAPVGAQRPYVVTVHDLQYKTFPHYFSAVKRRYLDAMIPRSVRGAAGVAVPSHYVGGTVIDEYGVSPDRVHVVPHGFEPALLQVKTDEFELRQRLGLGDGPVLFYPAMTAPHKNHRFLLRLMEEHWRDPDLRLVLTGSRGAAESDVAACTDPRVVRVGRVDPADRNGLLALSTAMVFPSQYEGFGAPLIEAMALGAPVVCSDATCIPDVVGDGALVRPLTMDAWATALDDVAAQRDDLVARGRARAASFTSRASGDALAEVYAAVLGAHEVRS
jgi:alpha-1,3-rhamnosyl/mannosyltransferase